MSRNGSLWIGGLEEYMDEDFILKCLNAMGETYSGVISIKVSFHLCLFICFTRSSLFRL